MSIDANLLNNDDIVLEAEIDTETEPLDATIGETPEIATSLDGLRYLVFEGQKGDTGETGAPGHSPYINASGYWVFWNDSTGAWVTTNYKAAGTNGTDGHSPYIGQNGNWFAWSEQLAAFDDTGVAAHGATGADGEDGYSPAVTIAEITGGHSVTITDKDHPSGQTFNVMDGEDAPGELVVHYATATGSFDSSFSAIKAALTAGKTVRCEIESGASIFYANLHRDIVGAQQIGDGYYSFDYVTYSYTATHPLWFGHLAVFDDGTLLYKEGYIDHTVTDTITS